MPPTGGLFRRSVDAIAEQVRAGVVAAVSHTQRLPMPITPRMRGRKHKSALARRVRGALPE